MMQKTDRRPLKFKPTRRTFLQSGTYAATAQAAASWFGQETTGAGVVTFAIVDMHEHLGQSIAYARMNQIVPPWSR